MYGLSSHITNGKSAPRGALYLNEYARGFPPLFDQLQPLVAPQVSHFRQVPLRTMVKFWHSVQLSPV